jgi:hypothetical protein
LPIGEIRDEVKQNRGSVIGVIGNSDPLAMVMSVAGFARIDRNIFIRAGSRTRVAGANMAALHSFVASAQSQLVSGSFWQESA